MDKNKATGFSGIGSFPVKRAKVKLPLPSDNLIALGASSTSSSPSSSTAASKLALGKRDRVDVQNVIAVKKPKLPVPQLRPGSADNWNDAVEIDPQDLLQKVLNCDESSSEVEAYIGGAIKNMKSSRLKLDSALYLTLLYLAKVKAQAFMNEPTIELLCSILKREPAQNAAIRKKLNANNNIQIIASNLMLAVYSDEIYWPKQFMKVYLDDALTERIWVDRVAPEVILLEGVLVKLLNMGILKSHPITPVEAIEMADLLIKRAAAYSDPADPIRGLNIQSEELFNFYSEMPCIENQTRYRCRLITNLQPWLSVTGIGKYGYCFS
ncbi:Integrator complex subunit 1 [Halotydeus destructor]|nr:Integrator complex subunit 1 [Halotydeus destructor]